MDEIWKDIVDFEGFYQVSNLGNVKSLKRTVIYSDKRKYEYPETILKVKISNGYKLVNLSKQGFCLARRIHRLMALAFIPNPENKPQINHIDGNKLNNDLCNLEWCTISENSKHAVRMGLLIMPDIKGAKNGKSKLTELDILTIRKLIVVKKVSELAKIYGVSMTQIGYIRDRKTWKHI